MAINTKITRSTERSAAIIIDIDEECNEKYYNEYLKKLLHSYFDEGILCGVTLTAYRNDKELVMTFCGQQEQIDELVKIIHSKS